MKRIIAIAMAVAVMASSTACTIQRLPKKKPDRIIESKSTEQKMKGEAEALCRAIQAEALLNACGNVACYLETAVYDIDRNHPDPEDFWLIMSIAVYGAYPERLTEFGTIDLKAAEVKDIASTLFPEFDKSAALPATKDTYAAEYVTAEGLYELQPMTISRAKYELGSLQNLNSAKDSYLMEIHLIDCSGKPSDQSKNAEVNGNGADEQAVWATWNVLFEAWNDGREHVFPHRVMRVWKP